MAESFDTAASSEGANVAGDTITGPIFVAAAYLVYGPAGGPYERVDDPTPLPVRQSSDSSTIVRVDAAPITTTLLAANANRRGATVYNDTSLSLYLALGSGASTETYTLKVAAGGYYELPFGYTGVVTGIWPSASAGTGTADGEALVTELS